MRKALNSKKAAFKMSTFEFMKHDLCCMCLKPRSKLRNSVPDRKILNYRMGLDRINKEMDIGVVLKKIRMFSFFMKSQLTKNQRNLLKLKSSRYIPSSDDLGEAGIDRWWY